MVLKIYQKEKAYFTNPFSFEWKPRQLLVTASPQLTSAIKKDWSNLERSIVRAVDDSELPVALADNDDLAKLGSPAFASFQEFLLILDRNLAKPLLASVHIDTQNRVQFDN